MSNTVFSQLVTNFRLASLNKCLNRLEAYALGKDDSILMHEVEMLKIDIQELESEILAVELRFKDEN